MYPICHNIMYAHIDYRYQVTTGRHCLMIPGGTRYRYIVMHVNTLSFALHLRSLGVAGARLPIVVATQFLEGGGCQPGLRSEGENCVVVDQIC